MAYVITPSDQSGLIVINATLFMSWMVTVCLVRLYMRLTMNGPLGLDDLAALTAGVLGIANVGTVMNSVSHGLGKSQTDISASQITSAEKALYAADLLFIAGHCAAKMSVCLLLRRLGREKLYLSLCKALLLLTSVWGIASIFAIALKCQLSQPWIIDQHCSNITLRWKLITTFDVIIEAFLVALSVYLVWGVRMHHKRKAAVVFAFACRLLIIVIAIVRQTYLTDAFLANVLLYLSDEVITTEVLLHCSIMAATIPCLKPFVVAFNTGWGQGIKGKGGSYFERSAANSSYVDAVPAHAEPLREDGPEEMMTTGSLDSQNSRQLIIHQTREWRLHTDYIEMKPMTK